MDPNREIELVNLCKGDLSHFTELYDVYVKDVYRYAYSRLYNQTEAEDITSETFLKALEKISQYSPQEGKSIKCWLFVIARNLIVGKFRKKEMVEFDEEYTAFHDEKILDSIVNKDMVKKVEDYIIKFKPPVPEIIQLRIWEELKFEEIATILGKSEAAIKVAYYRALEKINAEFIEKGKEENHG